MSIFSILHTALAAWVLAPAPGALYHLKAAPGETTEVAKRPTELVARLTEVTSRSNAEIVAHTCHR